MTPTLKAKLREELGPMTSDSKCDAVVRAVLEGIREPTPAMIASCCDRRAEFSYRGIYAAMIGELLSQGEAVE